MGKFVELHISFDMILQIFIENSEGVGSFREFPINENKISGWFLADPEIVDYKPYVCVNIILDGGIYSVKYTTELRTYLNSKFGK